jgi:hypothetical protein
VPALWLWTLLPRPGERLARLLWGLGPVLATAFLIFLLRGADLAALIGAAGTGALPAALVVGGAVPAWWGSSPTTRRRCRCDERVRPFRRIPACIADRRAARTAGHATHPRA